MTWSNLLSGLVGAGLGGLLAIAASIMTMRGQRSLALAATAEDKRQAQLRASYTASAQILGDMVTIKRGLDAMAASGLTLSSPLTPLYCAAVDAAERIFVVYNASIADQVLRSRINALIGVIDQWDSRENEISGDSVQAERRNLVMAYMEYVNQSIRAHLDDKPLPPDESAPDLLAVKNEEPLAADAAQQEETAENDQ